MKMVQFYLLLLSFALISCTKADPEAYRSDPILQDYQAQLAATNSALEAALKKVESAKKDIKDSIPQSGQLVNFQKQLFESQAQVSRLTQQVQFWKIRMESRAKEAQSEYLIAFKEKKEWPDKRKVEAYFTEKRLRLAKLQWNQKDRIKEYENSSSSAPPSGHGAAAPPTHGGGHE